MSFHRSLIGAALLAGVFTIPAWADGTFKFAFPGYTEVPGAPFVQRDLYFGNAGQCL